MPHEKPQQRPDEVPFLLPQPVEGEPFGAVQLVNRYGTYEIQPTSDSENFYPAIGAGNLSDGRLNQVRRQSKINTSDSAAEQKR